MGSILAETVKNETLTHLYIAAPFDDADLISRIISAIPKQIKVFYGDDMEKPRILLYIFQARYKHIGACIEIFPWNKLHIPEKVCTGKVRRLSDSLKKFSRRIFIGWAGNVPKKQFILLFRRVQVNHSNTHIINALTLNTQCTVKLQLLYLIFRKVNFK